VINNVDDVLLISQVCSAINSTTPSDLRYTLYAVVLTLVSVCPTLQPKIQADPMHDEGEREIHDEKWITWKRYHASQDENCRNLKRKATKQEWLSTAQWQCTETVKHRSNQVLGVRLSSCRQMTVNGN